MPNSVLGSASSLPCRRDDGATVVPSWSLCLSCVCEETSEQNLETWSEVNLVSESLLSETFKHVFKLPGFYFERFREKKTFLFTKEDLLTPVYSVRTENLPEMSRNQNCY